MEFYLVTGFVLLILFIFPIALVIISRKGGAYRNVCGILAVMIAILLVIPFFVPNSFWQQHEKLMYLMTIFGLSFLPVAIFVIPIIIPGYLIWGVLMLSKPKKPLDFD
jgi:hypothetical protein